MVRPDKIVEVLNHQSSSNESNSEEEHSHVKYITTADDRTADEVLTFVDVYNTPKFSVNQESCIPEDFFQDSGEEKECQHNAHITKQCEGIIWCFVLTTLLSKINSGYKLYLKYITLSYLVAVRILWLRIIILIWAFSCWIEPMINISLTDSGKWQIYLILSVVCMYRQLSIIGGGLILSVF